MKPQLIYMNDSECLIMKEEASVGSGTQEVAENAVWSGVRSQKSQDRLHREHFNQNEKKIPVM